MSGWGRAPLGIGEPIWAERSQAELVECERHEALLNLAFAGSTEFTLLCPYDIGALDARVVDTARRNHPFVIREGSSTKSGDYAGAEQLARPFTDPLPAPPSSSVELRFRGDSLVQIRSLVRQEATRAGLGDDRADDAVAAVNEVVSNTMRHGGGHGVLRIWSVRDTLFCEVNDDGHIDEPLVGRHRPTVDTPGGRGLWMVNQLCDLVQMRSDPTGTTVRMHLRRSPA